MTDSILVSRELLERVAGIYVGRKHRAGVEALGELRDLLTRPASEPKPVRQYYYKVDNCPAASSGSTAREDGCICWHDEGTGPSEALKSLGYSFEPRSWRDKEITAPAGVLLPERRTANSPEINQNGSLSWREEKAADWNDCLDEMAKLNGALK